MPIGIRFAIEPSEIAAIELGARRAIGPRRATVSTIVTSEGDATGTELEIWYEDHKLAHERDAELAAARVQAADVWRDVRRAARLPPTDARIIAVYPFGISGERPAYMLLDDAEEMFDERRYELSVLAAQAVCESVTRDLMFEAYASAGSDAAAWPVAPSEISRWSLRELPSRLLFVAVTGQDPAGCEWWPEYAAHVTRRNHIAHRGALVTEDEARKSINVMWSFIDFVREALHRG